MKKGVGELLFEVFIVVDVLVVLSPREFVEKHMPFDLKTYHGADFADEAFDALGVLSQNLEVETCLPRQACDAQGNVLLDIDKRFDLFVYSVGIG